MTIVSTQMPDALLRHAKAVADREKITLDELISRALAEQIEGLEALRKFEDRKRRGNWKRAVEILQKAPDVEPAEEDRLN